MRCLKCGRGLGLITKFCPKCGKAVTDKQKRNSMIAFAVWSLIFLALTFITYYSSRKHPGFIETTNLNTFLISAFTAFIIVGLLLAVYMIISAIVRLVIRQPIFGSIVVGVILVFTGFGVYTYLSDVSGKNFSSSLALIQDNLAEVTVAKLLGDSLDEGKPFITASWQRVNIEAQMVSSRLEEMDPPKELVDYKEAVIAWSDTIAASSKDTSAWDDVPDEPGVFELIISDKRAQKLFEDSSKKIAELKEFGDLAIKDSNKISMLYVGARLKVQDHWLNGILDSTAKNGLFSLNFVSRAIAAPATNIPDTGTGIDVTCQACNSLNVKMTEYQRRIYGCETRCHPTGKTSTGGTTGTGGATGQQKSGTTGTSAGGTAKQSKARQVCIGRGGTATGPVTSGGTPGNVYCLEDVVQSTTGIDASIIEIAKGKTESKQNWDNGWHNLEGTGIVLSSGTSSSGLTPTVQQFYNDCSSAGGTVGGPGISKSRLPTTEFGYTCVYKNNDGNECWDFLTYSGGRHMGGNPGCKEQNLLGNSAEKQAKDKKAAGGKWDGHYTGTVTASCVSTVPERPSYSQSFSMDFTVVNNVTFDQPVNAYVNISDSGSAIETAQQTVGGEGVTAYVYMIAYYQFYQSGSGVSLSASGSMDATGVREDGTYYASCTVSGSGARQ